MISYILLSIEMISPSTLEYSQVSFFLITYMKKMSDDLLVKSRPIDII